MDRGLLPQPHRGFGITCLFVFVVPPPSRCSNLDWRLFCLNQTAKLWTYSILLCIEFDLIHVLIIFQYTCTCSCIFYHHSLHNYLLVGFLFFKYFYVKRLEDSLLYKYLIITSYYYQYYFYSYLIGKYKINNFEIFILFYQINGMKKSNNNDNNNSSSRRLMWHLIGRSSLEFAYYCKLKR